MEDRIPRYPGRVRLEPVEGQANVFDLTRADEPEQEGTPLSKATLLTDATGEALRLNKEDDPTVNDALNRLSYMDNGVSVLIRVKLGSGKPVPGMVVNTDNGEWPDETVRTGVGGEARVVVRNLSEPVTLTVMPALDVVMAGETSIIVTSDMMSIVQELDVVAELSAEPNADVIETSVARLSGLVDTADIFAVGGGAGGGINRAVNPSPMAGSGGGYTSTILDVRLEELGLSLMCTIGSGGARVQSSSSGVRVGNPGGDTSVFLSLKNELLLEAGGGQPASNSGSSTERYGGSGGSGGGSGNPSNTATDGYGGGSDGANGLGPYGGEGQGRTTRAFGELDGELFSGGGGSSGTPAPAGGAGGGGAGGYGGAGGGGVAAENATNYGGAGGAHGTGNASVSTAYSGAGYQGIVKLRWRYAT